MGRSFNFDICVGSCECQNKKSCQCETYCITTKDEDDCDVCNCKKIKTDRYYLRNNVDVSKHFRLGDDFEHFLYRDLEVLLNGLLIGKSKIETLWLGLDEYDYDNEFIRVIAYILFMMKNNNSKCVWLANY